jgi:hypothetical protein
MASGRTHPNFIHPHTTFGLAQDPKNLGFAISGQPYAKSHQAFCQEKFCFSSLFPWEGGYLTVKPNDRTALMVSNSASCSAKKDIKA